MNEYNLHEIVWAKIKGYPWWPAVVKNIYIIKIDHRNKIRDS